MALVSRAKWKPLLLPKNILTQPNIDCLVGIEELTDYSLISKNDNKSKFDKIIVGPKNSKKKATKVERKKRPSDLHSEVHSSPKRRKSNIFKIEDCNAEATVDELDLLPWENIYVPNEISRSLLEQGFKQPTEIQALSIPAAIKGRRDLLGAAETGSGKTLAFGIPIIYGIIKNLDKSKDQESNDEPKLWALVLTPTRELAIQVKEHLEVAAKYTEVKVAVLVGGMSLEKQERLLSKKPHIVVATPGRLWELMSHPHLSDIQNIRFLVIDETDRMLEREHFPELRNILEKINTDFDAKKHRQNFVFSATLTFVHEPLKHTKKKNRKIKKLTPEQKLQNIMETLGITDPKVIDATKEKGTAENLVESKITCSLPDKDVYLYYFLVRHPGRTLVFCNSISCVRRLTSLFGLLKVKPLSLHAEMHQRQRLKNLDRFKEDPTGLLISTDVAARGLDIPKVEHVIHFQVPRTSESYIHRSGRTARAERVGLTVVLVEPTEIKLYTKLCVSLHKCKDIPEFPVDEILLSKVKGMVKCARDIDKLELNFRKTQMNSTWVEETAKKMDIILDRDEMPFHPDEDAVAKHKKIIQIKKKTLSELLASPVIENYKEEEGSAMSKMKSSKQKSKLKVFKHS